MKKTFCILFILVSNLIISQEFYEMDMKREKPKLKNYYLQTTTLVDSSNVNPYVSTVQIFDRKGRHKISYEFDRKGDTIEKIKSFYPDKLTEIEIHSYKTEKSDTALFKYNKRNLQTKEIWSWGEDETTDTTQYYYDKSKKLTVIKDFYDFGTTTDSLFYKDGKIVLSKSYGTEKILNDSIVYIYERKNLIKIKKFNSDNILVSDYDINEKDKKINRIALRTRLFKNKEFEKKSLTEFEHYNNGEIKTKTVSDYIDGQVSKTTELKYSELGFLEKIIVKDKEGIITYSHKITLHNNVYKK